MRLQRQQLRELRDIFFQYEDLLARSGILLDWIPSYVGVELEPKVYHCGVSTRLKCSVKIEVPVITTLSEHEQEMVSDSIYDWLKARRVELELRKLGLDPDVFDWVQINIVQV